MLFYDAIIRKLRVGSLLNSLLKLGTGTNENTGIQFEIGREHPPFLGYDSSSSKLVATDDGVNYYPLNRPEMLMIKIPTISVDDNYQITIDLSASASFDTVTTITSSNANYTSLFKVFTGRALSSIDTSGLGLPCSESILLVDISSFSKSLTHIRYAWSNNESGYSDFYYGNRNGILLEFTASSEASGDTFIDAPSDDGQYVRKNGEWSKLDLTPTVINTILETEIESNKDVICAIANAQIKFPKGTYSGEMISIIVSKNCSATLLASTGDSIDSSGVTSLSLQTDLIKYSFIYDLSTSTWYMISPSNNIVV